jgi:hypothetical protein
VRVLYAQDDKLVVNSNLNVQNGSRLNINLLWCFLAVCLSADKPFRFAAWVAGG